MRGGEAGLPASRLTDVLRLTDSGCVAELDWSVWQKSLFSMLRICFLLLATISCVPQIGFAGESTGQLPVVDIYIVRSGESLQSPHVVTYKVLEWTELRGRWIFPDVGYFDNGYGKDQVWFAGAGLDVVHTRHVDWSQELYVTQEAGPDSTNKRSLWIWPVVDMHFGTRVFGQVAAYPTIPLNDAQRWGADVDRAKLEWAASTHWLVGGGYSGGICGDSSWHSNPFITATRRTRAGNVEFWLQRITGGAQVQVRYVLVKSRR